MTNCFDYRPADARVALELEGYYIWDCAVIRAEGKYYMFSSRWPERMGFGWNWLFNSEIIQSVAERPEGPFRFLRVVLPRRGPGYFDGMNTHNTCIREYQGKYYLYYMGTTYEGEPPETAEDISYERAAAVWSAKRIGVAVADHIEGPFVRRDAPLLLPRSGEHWDCTAITNPTVAILPDGKTYMIYKSRRGEGAPLQLGVTVADRPDGPFRRLCDQPILELGGDLHVEDPYLWYDTERQKFCMIAKDDVKNGAQGITGEWGSGFYAESEDCIHFSIAKRPQVYSRTLTFADGRRQTMCNLERPWVLMDEQDRPVYLHNATGQGSQPYSFEGRTFVLGQRLEPEP